MNFLKGNAIKLYVFVDTPEFESERPLLVIINRFKCILDLRKEFEENHDYWANEQYWLIDGVCCSDDMDINSAVENADSFKNGYIVYLFIISKEQKNKIPEFIDTYLERKYSYVDPSQRWNEVVGAPIIISDILDYSQPIPKVGWNCETCTFFNKAYRECCDTCGYSRPTSYVVPKNCFLTQDDEKRIKQQIEQDELRKKSEEEHAIQMVRERDDYRKRLELMYKEKVAYSTEPIECPICAMDYPAGEAVVLHGCHHTICKDCLKGYLINADDPKVKCPMDICVGIIEDGEISGMLTEEEFKKYEQLNLRKAEAITENSFHCKTPNCVAWVVYDGNVNVFDCLICKKNNCIPCQAIHEKQTCKEYQDELALKAKNDEAARKDLEFLEDMIKTGKAMKCPGCKIIVQKMSGCDYMTCNMCKIAICWATKGPRWGPKGAGDTSGGCKCRVNGIRCTPTCGNCH